MIMNFPGSIRSPIVALHGTGHVTLRGLMNITVVSFLQDGDEHHSRFLFARW